MRTHRPSVNKPLKNDVEMRAFSGALAFEMESSMRAEKCILSVLAMTTAAHAQSPVEPPLWQQVFVALIPFMMFLVALGSLIYLARSVFKSWHERHMRVLEAIENHLASISNREPAPPYEDPRKPKTAPNPKNWTE